MFFRNFQLKITNTLIIILLIKFQSMDTILFMIKGDLEQPKEKRKKKLKYYMQAVAKRHKITAVGPKT